jgi:hypothetical protein
LHVFEYTTGFVWRLQTTQVFRDASAWYHIVVAVDTTQATASNRVKIYVNGAQITVFGTASYPSQNTDTEFNNTVGHAIGRNDQNGSNYLGAYLADIFWIDGQQLDPSSFTETDATTGQLIPKAYTGSYGTNGFKLSFSDNSTKAALGIDSSGNNNTWTVNNLYPGGANYSSRGSLSASPPILSGTIADIFDGSLAAAGGSFSVNQANAGVTVSFSPALPSGSLVKLIGNVYGTASSNSSLQVNGTSYAQSLPSSPGTGTDTELSVPAGTSGITSIYIYREGVSDFNYTLFGITVDGILLVDAAAGASLVDVPTNGAQTDTGVGGEVRGNYSVLNPLKTTFSGDGGNPSYSNGNLDVTGSSGTSNAINTIGVSSGKFYFECTLTATTDSNAFIIGLNQSSSAYSGNFGLRPSGSFPNGTITSGSAFTFGVGDTVGIAYEPGVSATFYKNNNASSFVASLSSGIWFSWAQLGGTGVSAVFNFGQRPFINQSVPSGFKALCSANLPAPLVTKPNTVMDVLTWTGTGGSRTFSGLGFSPDLIWGKGRSQAYNHQIYDIIRDTGASKVLMSNSTAAEGSANAALYGYVSGFNSNGFATTAGTTDNSYWNELNTTYVAWTWDAGSSTVTNTQGSISSQVRANATAGFSIVTYTGTGTNATVGHGLGVSPSIIFLKSRGGTRNWVVYSSSLTSAAFYLSLNQTIAQASLNTVWNSTAPTSTVFNIGTDLAVNNSSETYVAYCFAPVVGYSSFGSYTGNGSADGPFVYTGFRPRWVLIKYSSGVQDWILWDAARTPYNAVTSYLLPSKADAEDSSSAWLDFTSNGFKIRQSNSAVNTNNGTYIYAAFAESPFNYARAR